MDPEDEELERMEMEQQYDLETERLAERFWEDRPDLGSRYHDEAMADADLYEQQRNDAMGEPERGDD